MNKYCIFSWAGGTISFTHLIDLWYCGGGSDIFRHRMGVLCVLIGDSGWRLKFVELEMRYVLDRDYYV
jgi:hypothetical protein